LAPCESDGNATEVSRRILDLPRMLTIAQLEGQSPRARMDWSQIGGITEVAGIDAMLPLVGALEDKSYRSTTQYDARGRAIEATLPMSGSTHRWRYTEDGLLRRLDRETAAGTTERVYEADDFDERGRPRTVHHGDAATSTSTYDPVTERLLRLQSRGAGKLLQDLQYTYDPVGNITQVRDGAQATIVRDNAALEAVNDYRYDALYRLVEATGREHEGQAANGRTPRSGDAPVIPLRAVSPNDPRAMRRYVQRYRYDAVGNLMTLQHQAGAGSFRRESAYSAFGNRLRATGNAAISLAERYDYDVAGHMVAMPHLSRLHWNELGELEFVQRGTQQVWLQYAGGVRVRKLVFSGQGVVEDRVYLGGEEMFTKRRAGVVVEQTLTEHAGGGLQVDIKLVADGKVIAKPVALRRHALADHLGSAKLEVDGDGAVIAYEEFHPYGTTSYRAMRSSLDAAANRYRFTGMERDEETGLALHGARYYAAWLGRWVSADPIGVAGGINCYAYCSGDPIGLRDPTGAAPETVVVETESCNAECRAGVIESYKAARSAARDEYMNQYAEWMRRSSDMDADERADATSNLRAKYSEWQDYGDALGQMYAAERGISATERGAGRILASKTMIAAAAIIGVAGGLGAGVAGVAATALEGAGFGVLSTYAGAGAAGGAVDGALSSGGLALLGGASLGEAASAALEGGGWGAAAGGVLGYFGARLVQRFASGPTTLGRIGGTTAAPGVRGGSSLPEGTGASVLDTPPAPAPWTKASAQRLLDASEGASGPGKNVGHSRAHIPRAGEDPRVLAQMRPGKNNTTVYRSERQAIQDLRDALQSRAEAISGLARGDLYEFVWRMVTPRIGYNSFRGAAPTEVTFRKVTVVISRTQGGRLHLVHFSPSL
jgi:RHS repeat-associated protein